MKNMNITVIKVSNGIISINGADILHFILIDAIYTQE